MATTATLYDSITEYLGDGTIILDTDTIKLALVTSAYTFSAAHTIWGDASANEVSNGDGYTTGGASLASVTWVRSGGTTTLDAADVTFTALTKTFRRGIIYANVTRNTIVNPLLCSVLFDNTPADIVISGTDWAVRWNASGIAALAKV